MEFNIMEKNNMKTKKIYEIIDTAPTAILTNIPIIDIFIYLSYYILLPIYVIKRFIKEKYFNPFFFIRKKEKTFLGKENNDFIQLKDLNLNPIKLNNSPEFTNIIFHYRKEALSLANELNKKGFHFDLKKLSKNFIIKEKTEYYNEHSNIEQSTEVFFNQPSFLKKIEKIVNFK